MKFGYETWFTEKVGQNVVTFKVFPSGTYVIQSIHRDGRDVTDSITTNRYVSGMIRFMVANQMIQY